MLENVSLETIVKISLKAGEEIMKVYAKDFEIAYKPDDSPLTEADTLANKIICEALMAHFPMVPILSEETKAAPYEERKEWEYYWCVDPIDGTKEFIKKNGQFTVNIALIHKNIPVLGVVYAPAMKQLYAAKKEEGAYKQNFDISNAKTKLPLHVKDSMVVVASKSHRSPQTQHFIEILSKTYPNLQIDSKGSSLKLCMVAEGSANIYPRIAPTMEWDTAAAHAIVLESGKGVYKYDSKLEPLDYIKGHPKLEPVVYNKPNLLNPDFVVV
jgi:3'(2'), 5'-bisphosphate nucleotidase